MTKHIRTSLLAATAAIAISATAATAAVPTWFDASDRNQDSRVTWNEFVRENSNYDKLDENGDGLITVNDHFLLDGREESSLTYVEYLDTNRNGAVRNRERVPCGNRAKGLRIPHGSAPVRREKPL